MVVLKALVRALGEAARQAAPCAGEPRVWPAQEPVVPPGEVPVVRLLEEPVARGRPEAEQVSPVRPAARAAEQRGELTVERRAELPSDHAQATPDAQYGARAAEEQAYAAPIAES